jgi:hypothetical protein
MYPAEAKKCAKKIETVTGGHFRSTILVEPHSRTYTNRQLPFSTLRSLVRLKLEIADFYCRPATQTRETKNAYLVICCLYKTLETLLVCGLQFIYIFEKCWVWVFQTNVWCQGVNTAELDLPSMISRPAKCMVRRGTQQSSTWHVGSSQREPQVEARRLQWPSLLSGSAKIKGFYL